MASSWSAETVKSLNEVSGQDTGTIPQKITAFEPKSETQRPSEETPITREPILQACSDGDLSRLQALFTELEINPGHPLIKPQHYGQESVGGSLPFTSEMLEVATRNKHAQIISHIFTTFPTTSVSHSVVSAAVEHKDISIFSLLLAQNPDILNRELGDHQGPPLSFAVWGSDPSFASFLLDKGADPNLGGFGPLSNLFYTADHKLARPVVSSVTLHVAGSCDSWALPTSRQMNFRSFDTRPFEISLCDGVEVKWAIPAALGGLVVGP